MLGAIRAALKEGKLVIGYRQSIKCLKSGSPRHVIIASGIPDPMSREIRHNARLAGVKVEVFRGTSRDLGMACGKPFPIAVLTIRE
jgi:large subunit ribosomal protein L30e